MTTGATFTDEEGMDFDYDLSTAMDAAGNPSPLDAASVITVDVDEPGIVIATVNGTRVSLDSENAVDAESIGQAVVTVTITPPSGDPITDLIGVTVTPSAPTQINASAGAARPRQTG